MADVDSEIAAAEKKVQQSREAYDQRIYDQQADDRSYIAKLVVRVFVGLVVLVVLAVIAGIFYFCGDWDKLVEPAKFLMAILGSILLPVVTLVIGYYFGSK